MAEAGGNAARHGNGGLQALVSRNRAAAGAVEVPQNMDETEVPRRFRELKHTGVK